MTSFLLYRAKWPLTARLRGHRARSGIALILVVTVLAFVAIVGFSMLSTASMQAAATRNSNHALAADALAESGFDLACYYLINPDKAPTPLTTGPSGSYWSGGTLSFGPSMPGAVTITITPLANANEYRIVCAGQAGNSELVRNVVSTVRANRGYQVKSAVGFSQNGYLPLTSTVHGDVQANGVLINAGIINGNVLSPNPIGGLGTILGGLIAITPSNNTPIPNAATLRNYATYSYRGASYNAATITGLPTGTTLGPTPGNPAGIYRFVGPLTMNHNVVINGTLIVEGDLNISGGGNHITPADAFPGLIVKGNTWVRGTLLASTSPRDLTVNGLAWIGGGLKSSGLLSNSGFNVNGALQFGGSASVDTLYTSKLTVTTNPNNVDNLDVDTSVPPASTKVLSYKQ
jgi:hypothetical protein